MDATVLTDVSLRDAPHRGLARFSRVRLDKLARDTIHEREAKLDQMIADSFPASDPPSR